VYFSWPFSLIAEARYRFIVKIRIALSALACGFRRMPISYVESSLLISVKQSLVRYGLGFHQTCEVPTEHSSPFKGNLLLKPQIQLHQLRFLGQLNFLNPFKQIPQ
jgi:hypothetical protein